MGREVDGWTRVTGKANQGIEDCRAPRQREVVCGFAGDSDDHESSAGSDQPSCGVQRVPKREVVERGDEGDEVELNVVQFIPGGVPDVDIVEPLGVEQCQLRAGGSGSRPTTVGSSRDKRPTKRPVPQPTSRALDPPRERTRLACRMTQPE